MSTSASLALHLKNRIEREFPFLEALSEEAASIRSAPGAWSPKEELGHLIDSAVNNHARFVIGSIASELRGPSYAQDDWVRLHGYSEISWKKIAGWWNAHNEALIEVIARIPEDRLSTQCYIGNSPVATLRFIIEDYGVHLQHHVDHLLSRPVVTRYPAA